MTPNRAVRRPIRKTFIALVAAAGLAAVFLTSCGSDSDSDDTTAPNTASATETTLAVERTLRVGTLLPLTGLLSSVGPPSQAAAQMAEAEINAAPTAIKVELTERDSGTNNGIASRAAAGLIDQNVDAIVGTMASGVSRFIIDQIVGADTIMFSPGNSSSFFTTYNDNGLYFRTAIPLGPGAEATANRVRDMVADEEEADRTVLLINRDDEIGVRFAEVITQDLREVGVTVLPGFEYPGDDTSDFPRIAAQTAASAPAAIVVLAFQEVDELLRELIAAGVNPQNTYIILTSVSGADLGSRVDPDNPGVVAGIESQDDLPLPGAEPTFAERFANFAPGVTTENPSFLRTTYDAVVILVLAALAADSTDPQAVAAEINGITRGGRECQLFAECAAMIASGEDILYSGALGALNFSDVGEPTRAAFEFYRYAADGTREATGDRIIIGDTE